MERLVVPGKLLTRQQLRRALLFAWGMGLLMAFGLSGVASANAVRYFGSNDVTGSFNNSLNPWSWLAVGETSYVRNAEVHVRVYFNSEKGNKIYIENLNYCTGGSPDLVQSGDKIATDGLANTKEVTKVELSGVLSDGGGAKRTAVGRKYVATSNCSSDVQVPIYKDDSSRNMLPQYNKWLKKYFVKIDVTHIDRFNKGYDGIQNMFRIRAETSDGTNPLIYQSENKSGYGVTVEQGPDMPKYSDYTVRFGSSCDVSGGRSEKLYFYDLDNNGGGGAQPTDGPPVKVKLYKGLPGSNVDDQIKLSGGGGSLDRDGKTWIPGNRANATAEPEFWIQPGYKYKLVIEQVYENNTVQFSTPMNGVYWEKPCDNKPPNITIDCDVNGVVFGRAWDPDLNNITDRDGTPEDVRVRLLYGNGDDTGKSQKTFQTNKAYRFEDLDMSRGYKVRVTDRNNYGESVDTTYDSSKVEILNNIPRCAPTSSIGCVLFQPIDSLVLNSDNNTITVRLTKTAGSFSDPSSVKIRVDRGVDWNATINDIKPSGTGKNIATATVNNYSTGTYSGISTVYATINSQPEETCGTFNVGRQPYFSVVGGDVATKSDIEAQNGGRARGYKGAYSQIAAFATGQINSFISGEGLINGRVDGNVRSLAFSNITNNTGLGFGGGLSSGLIPYIDIDVEAPANALMATQPFTINRSINGKYKFPSGSLLWVNGEVGAGQEIIIDSSSNVFINGDIFYQLTSDITKIPRLIIKAPSIYVGGNVTEIHGVFIVEHGFVTCATSAGAPITSFDDTPNTPNFTLCKGKNLKIYGGVIADKVHMSRIKGSWAGTGDEADPAETFQYSPEVWLPRGAPDASGYDSFISLPPVL